MGLLDDAIREHLELKRSHGADPEELARAEHEALEEGLPDEQPAPEIAAGDAAPALQADAEGGYEQPVGDAGAPVTELGAEDEPFAQERISELTSVGQETAELDMSTVLAEEDDQGEPPEQLPGQERLSFE